MNYHRNWGASFMGAAQNQTYLDWLPAGLKTTIAPGLSSWAIVLVIGSALGVLCTVSNKRLSGLTVTYVGVFRNILLIAQLFIWYLVMSEFVPGGDYIKQMNPVMMVFLSAMLCPGIFTAARVRERMRSGVNSLLHGQRNTGLAMGFTFAQTYRYVMLLISLRTIVPPFTSELPNIFRDFTVAPTIGLLEFAAQGRQLVDHTTQPYESFIAVTLACMLINLTVVGPIRWVEAHPRLPGFIGGK